MQISLLNEPVSSSRLPEEQKGTGNHINSHMIILHTSSALSLWQGDWKFGKMGMVQFAMSTTNLIEAIKNDDPYAELYFLKTYNEMIKAQQSISGMEKMAQALLSEIRGVIVSLWSNEKAVHHPMRFSRFANYAARCLIADVDYVVRQMITLDNLGMIYNREKLSIIKIKEIVQQVFAIPLYWHKTGVTRKDVREKNDKAKAAAAVFDELPPAVLNEEIDFCFSPKKRGKNDHSK